MKKIITLALSGAILCGAHNLNSSDLGKGLADGLRDMMIALLVFGLAIGFAAGAAASQAQAPQVQ